MKTHDHSFGRLAITALAGVVTVGTAAAQTAPDPATPQSGAYGGATYGGTAQPVPPPAPIAAEPEPVEPEPAEPPAYTAPTETYEEPYVSTPLYSQWGVGLALGGGVDDFTSDSINTGTGGSWNVRATVGTKQLLAFEGSYIGSAQTIDAIGLDTNAMLVGNGLQGALRLNLITGIDLDPFIFGGTAWRHYDIMDADFNNSDINGDDDVLELPVGVGVQYASSGFLFDARGEYRAATYGDMFDRPGDNQNMDRWGVQANIGAEF